MHVEDCIRRATGAKVVRRTARVQSLWSGYGEVARYALDGGETVVVKHVRPPAGEGLSHERKLRSYDVEMAWYTTRAASCPVRVPTCLAVEREQQEWLFVMEDLDAVGFAGRTRSPSAEQLEHCVRWLASFHAHHMGDDASGLWRRGTYWHLATRPDELAAMPDGALKRAAHAIDAHLATARFRTLVHGDAKPANFCFSQTGVAAVDFQYVGGGCGVQDLAYLCAGVPEPLWHTLVDLYFDVLNPIVESMGLPADELEAEWRAVYPWAWADFERFVHGWSRGWPVSPHERRMSERVCRDLP